MVFLVGTSLLLVKFLLAGAQTQNEPCCLPTKIEGQLLHLDEQRAAFFAIDFGTKKYLESIDPNEARYFLIDFGNGVRYDFKHGKYSKETFKNVKLFDQCYSKPSVIRTLCLGEMARGLDVKTFQHTANDISRTYFLSKISEGICLPTIAHDVHDHDGDEFGTTIVYYNVTAPAEISHTEMYFDLSECEEGQLC